MMQSCLFNEDDIFDESSAQRAIASVNECQEILKGAANGWLLEYYTGEDGEVTFADNQALKDAIDVYQKLVESGCTKQVSGWDSFVGAFNNGEVASVVTGCWIAPSIQKAEDQSGKWAVAPFPKMDANADSVNASSIGGGGWYVLKNCKRLPWKYLCKQRRFNEPVSNGHYTCQHHERSSRS